MSSHENEPLSPETLAARLRDLRPDEAFTDVVMAAVEREAARHERPAATGPANGWSEMVWRTGVPAVVLSAIAAAACLLLSLRAEDDLDADVLATIDVVEVVQ
jgi:hypothetical protein